MAPAAFLENFYAYQRPYVVFPIPQPSAEAAQLQKINDTLAAAGAAYTARQYQQAIDLYHRAAALIYSQLDPGYPLIGIPPGVHLSRDPALFDPLLSSSLEWLNLLPVSQAQTPVTSRVPVPAQLLQSIATIDNTALNDQAHATAADRLAAVRQTLGSRLTATGNIEAATFWRSGAAAAAAAHISVSLPPQAPAPPAPAPVAPQRSIGVLMNGTLTPLTWTAGDGPPLEQAKSTVYQARISLANLTALVAPPLQLSEVAVGLPHDYYYVIPLGIADSQHQLGDYANAESNYLQAAAYQYLNQAIEASFLWLRLASLYRDWGNSLFRADQPGAALPIYTRVLAADGTAPTTGPLYTTAALQPGTQAAQTIITHLTELLAGSVTIQSLNVNPRLAAIICDVHAQIAKLNAGLDFWGFPVQTVPIWTFDYLQGVASTFAQLAISAEQQMISFWDHADQATLTRQEMEGQLAQANAEVTAAQLQADAANAAVTTFSDGLALAAQRAADAQHNATEYAAQSSWANTLQAESAQIAGGDSGNPDQLNQLADIIVQNTAGTSGSRGTEAAAAQLAAAKASQAYEVDAMNRSAAELQTAQQQARDEVSAAQAAATAAQASATAASIRAYAAQQDLQAFDDQTFTPGVWHAMGDAMEQLYDRYLFMAIRVARLMQLAYNFETDQNLHVIKGDYTTALAHGLLGADNLLADIQGFTYNLITTEKSKTQPIRQTISLAGRYPYLFETQLRTTGVMEFETRIDDFDMAYPGTYAGRIDYVEVEVDGIVPPTGISGTLTTSGISAYRLPSAGWILATNPSGLKYRVQPAETLVLSDYSPRADAALRTDDPRLMRIFQGCGVVASWRLELPKAINDLDYGALTDVRLTFSYRARFDPQLRTQVLQQLQTHPDLNARQRAIPLRWLYPDAFFRFQATGQLDLTLTPSDFPVNQTKPTITSLGLLLATDGSVPAAGATVSLATPSHAGISAALGADGSLVSSTAGSAWGPLAAGTALGAYQLVIDPAANPHLVKPAPPFQAVTNVVLLLGYSFTPRG
ncbi:MAG TPA: hypothetical protein VMU89_22150 [Thermomicrobiaceae bacterium]|nr:hypothetical protein [Thermomicrobiaceae bacterium]